MPLNAGVNKDRPVFFFDKEKYLPITEALIREYASRAYRLLVSALCIILAGPLRNQAGQLETELDLDNIHRAKFDLDVTGHYARNDIFDFWAAGQPDTVIEKR